MGDMMTFPNTVEEFMEQYKIVDTEKIYTNGADLVPIFRMKQWFERDSTADMISRQAAITQLSHNKNKGDDEWELAVENDIQTIWKLPPAQPKIIQCKDCKYYDPIYANNEGVCGHWNAKTESNVYCAYAERKTE